jgi:hypothetical protein
MNTMALPRLLPFRRDLDVGHRAGARRILPGCARRSLHFERLRAEERFLNTPASWRIAHD